jgi:hypothetical protein
VPSTASAAPVPTKDTFGIELIGAAERAATAEPEALEAWVDNKAGRGHKSLDWLPSKEPKEGV